MDKQNKLKKESCRGSWRWKKTLQSNIKKKVGGEKTYAVLGRDFIVKWPILTSMWELIYFSYTFSHLSRWIHIIKHLLCLNWVFNVILLIFFFNNFCLLFLGHNNHVQYAPLPLPKFIVKLTRYYVVIHSNLNSLHL